jgi:hypothetical protein
VVFYDKVFVLFQFDAVMKDLGFDALGNQGIRNGDKPGGHDADIGSVDAIVTAFKESGGMY